MPRFSKCVKFALAFTAMSMGSAPAAHAAEVSVQNDSLQPGQSGFVQAGFASGEEAAAWLTSPCNGRIVAVQVFWQSVLGIEPPTLGEAIRIYGDGAFPTPGPILTSMNQPPRPAEFLGPVMTDGFLNEFRFLDEAGVIPLNVPVVAGQRFVVSFEFFDNTPALGPSVVSDSGCQNLRNSLKAIPGGWLNSCALGVSGDFVIRAVVDCDVARGACCLPNGTCSDNQTQTQCTGQGGIWRGVGTTCATQVCPEFARACCFQASGGCLNLTPTQCLGAGGSPGPAGSTCGTFVCFPIGACCLPNGSCVQGVSPTQCMAQQGVFQGNGTTCAGVMCPIPNGACCTPSGFCIDDLTQDDCETIIPGGMWAGPLTTCADANMDGTADVCAMQAPCPGDANGDRMVGIADLAIMIQQWAQSGAGLPGDVDGNGMVGLSDVALAIQNWGSVCP